MQKPAMILLDLDGTLVDSVPDLAYCIDEMMQRLGRAPHGEARVRGWVGNGVERLVKRALTGELQAEPDEDDLARAMPIFTELYAVNTSQRSLLFPGAREGLEQLQAAGIKLACVTNKAAQFTAPLLRDMDIADYFGIVVSGDTLPQQKPHPAPLLHAADFFKVTPAQALMVGDSMHDIEAARAANFAVVAVSYGYNHGIDIHIAKPDAVIDSLTELPALFQL
ncbi:MAG: phosphoglycolate phosphatase [Thiohalomonadaceae bacterium]